MMCHGRTNDLRSTSFGGHVELYAAYQQQFAVTQAQVLSFFVASALLVNSVNSVNDGRALVFFSLLYFF